MEQPEHRPSLQTPDTLPSPRRSSATPQDTLELLEKYRWDAQYLSAGHYLAAKRLARWGYTIGVLAIATASIASTSAFASLSTQPGLGWKIATGLLAAAAAGFAGLQTLLKLDDRASLHKTFGARFIEIRDEADRYLIKLKHEAQRAPDTMMDAVAEMSRKMATAAAEAPDLPDRDYDIARASFRPPTDRRRRGRPGRLTRRSTEQRSNF